MTKHDHSDGVSGPRAIFARNLRHAMELRGYTTRKFAAAVTMPNGEPADHRMVMRWRKGEAVPRVETMFEIAELLDVTPGWFFDYDHTTDEPVAA